MVTTSSVLPAVALLPPLAMLAACLSARLRERMPALLVLAPIPALVAALLAVDGATLVLPPALLGLTFVLDGPGRVLLGVAALLWIAAGAYAPRYRKDQSGAGQFAVWWLMTLTGSLGVFIAADMVGFYLFFTLVSLAAYGLIVDDDSPRARRAAAINISFALLSEALLLMAFVLVAAGAPDATILIPRAVEALPASPWRDPAVALLIVGFGLKIGLVPLHVWMPLTYSGAPVPVAAVLSGAAVKAGVIGLIRFLPFDAPLPGWGEALAAIGFLSAFYGVLVGLTQNDPRAVLAYSSVSQMGLIAAVLGMGVAAGDKSVPMAATFYAAHHVLVKGGLFLGLGLFVLSRRRTLWPVLLPAAVIALGLGGLPLTGGALAKLAAKGPLGDGIAGSLATLSSVASTLLMIHFLHCLVTSVGREPGGAVAAGLELPWLAIALAAIVVPWAIYPAVTGGSIGAALAPTELWAALWPVLVGAALSVGLRRWHHLLPRLPEGDILAVQPRAARVAADIGAAMESLDGYLRRWTTAGLLFLVITVLLAGTLVAGL